MAAENSRAGPEIRCETVLSHRGLLYARLSKSVNKKGGEASTSRCEMVHREQPGLTTTREWPMRPITAYTFLTYITLVTRFIL